MTPKRKAVQLVDKFLELNIKIPKLANPYGQSKQCAIICVDEIINNGFVNSQSAKYYLPLLPPKITDTQFWIKVKQEIEKL